MKRFLIPALFLFLAACATDQGGPQPPVAEKSPEKLEIHGDVRTDDYFWMRLSNAQKNADSPDEQTRRVLDYLEAENNYLQAVMEPTGALQDSLYEEIVGRMPREDVSVPVSLNGYSYYTRYEEGNQYPLYCRKPLEEDAEEEIMLDGPEMARGKAYFSIGEREVSEDNQWLAFTMDTVSRRQYTVYFKNLSSGELLPERIDNAQGITWANDNQTVFYSKKDPETLRIYQIYKHVLGSDPATDELVYEETDTTFNCYVQKSRSRDYLMLVSAHSEWTEYRYLDADTPGGEWTLFQPREKGLIHYVDHIDDYFVIRTNLDAKNYRLMKCPENATSKSDWVDFIPYNPEVLFEDMDHFENFSVLGERKDGLVQLHVIDRRDMSEYYIGFDDAAYNAYTTGNPEYRTNALRYEYSSFARPSTVYAYNMDSRERTLLKQDEVLGGDFDPDNYQVERIMATARDGASVPVSIVYHRDTERSPETPLLLYGYGSYGSNVDPSFSYSRLSLLDRGFIFAIAHIRGSQTLGRAWYEDGKLLNKKNTFYDFIDAGKYLVDAGYTSPGHLYAMGGSAGGLLMGAVVNMEPGLWNGVIAAVPFVDVISTMLDESIPLTTFEFDEWGNPTDPEYYTYMLSYSPYDNVEKKGYPNMLVTTGYWDSQVQYWEPAKWVAKLRDYKTDDHILLLDTNMDVGHGGASGRFERYRRTALEYAFLLQLERGGFGE
ncbi:S9 family peptidase [Robiginitalea sp. SC105]|uniref:S9 family peptidase n=1 Tax=Robiginitalea sp. SC105 TaxID=2762332 RepID=UPI00163AD137|nr:S9 family peptidase [Robiginitalea sp. SC105]MBC2838125.1 S9 family peptidase [Robiginitalea sp. SC105]